MEDNVLEVRMLGGFSLHRGKSGLEVSGRSRKLYLLLAYLIRERARSIPYEELNELLWPGAGLDAGTLNALKALLHRARRFLDGLGGDAGNYLLNRNGFCQWDPDVPLTLDAEEFSALCREEDGNKTQRLARRSRALSLYRGDFLPAADCPWAAGQAEELHQLWRRAAVETLPLLEEEGRWEQAAALAGEALSLEPGEEFFCRGRMTALLRLGKKREAVETYQSFQDVLLAQKGVLPSDELRELYRAAQNDPDPRAITPADLPRRLREPPANGALLCGFEFFRVLCFSLVRLAQRGKQPLHTALLTLEAERDISRHSLDRAMDNLQGIILDNLRRGDAVARCSASQFVLLLPQTGLENAQRVCRRVCRAYTRQFPHAPVKLEFAVLPLTSERDSQ